MSTCAVAVINHNTRDLLRACLRSVVSNAPAEIVVVDNVSTDGSAAMVRAEFPQVQVIENMQNHGYGAASNQSVAACKSEYILLLNSDTLLTPGTTAALSAYLDKNPKVAIAGPRLCNPDGTLQRSTFPFPHLLDVFLDSTRLGYLARWLPGVRERYLRTWSHNRERRVPWVSGAVLAIRRAAFEQVGGFDEDFFMYYEEVDLCYRLRRSGWQIAFTPLVETIHKGGASTSQRPVKMMLQFYASLDFFYRRHYSPWSRLGLSLLLRLIAAARLLRDGSRLLLTRNGPERQRLSSGCSAWKQLLLGKKPEENVVG